MKHGVAFRKFSRDTSHRMLMLRNLVTSLIEHEQIKTTLPKARDAARLAEKIITLGKKGDLPAYRRAGAFLLKPTVVPKVFETLAERYAHRPGGYTRIHKFGNRPGDNAPHAILELVDNPRDLKFGITARSIGWEMLGKRVEEEDAKTLINSGIHDARDVVIKEKGLVYGQKGGELRQITRRNMQKVLRYRSPDAALELGQKANDHIESMLAKPVALKEALKGAQETKATKTQDSTSQANEVVGISIKALRRKAGESLPGEQTTPLRLSKGSLGGEIWKPSWVNRKKHGIDRSEFWAQI